MNMNSVKKILAVMLASSLMAMPIVAGATDAPTPQDPPKSEVEKLEQQTSNTTATFNVGGTTIKSDVAGAYSFSREAAIAGLALRQSSDTIKSAGGYAKNEKPFVRAYGVTAKSSPAVFASLNGAAQAMGGTVLGAANVDFGKMVSGQFKSSKEGTSVPATLGVDNKKGLKLAVAKVQPKGATEILEDQDDNPNTVTVPIEPGIATYGIIGY